MKRFLFTILILFCFTPLIVLSQPIGHNYNKIEIDAIKEDTEGLQTSVTQDSTVIQDIIDHLYSLNTLGNSPPWYLSSIREGNIEVLYEHESIDIRQTPSRIHTWKRERAFTEIYRQPPEPIAGKWEFQSKRRGLLQRDPPHNREKTFSTNKFEIAYTIQGDAGPLLVMLHGVPTNRTENYPIMELMGGHCRILSPDMLGMGESSIPKLDNPKEDWKWKNDVDWLEEMVLNEETGLFKETSGTFAKTEKVIWVGKDWGGAHMFVMAAKYPERTQGLILIDPIYGPSHPVAEIEAIGRLYKLRKGIASALNKEAIGSMNAVLLKNMAIGAFDQTVVQILKTMTLRPEVWDQWTLRDVKKTYVDADYERNEDEDGKKVATALTMKLKEWNIDVLADRASILSPHLLLPKHETKNKEGIEFNKITAPVLVIWGRKDNMMSAEAAWRIPYMCPNAKVSIRYLDGGHYIDRELPKEVSEIILNWITENWGVRELAGIFFGFGGNWKGDETRLIRNLENLYDQSDF